MSVIEIDSTVKIFDDPEYCANSDLGYCQELYRIDGTYYCHKYAKHGSGVTIKFAIEKDGLHCTETPLKCHQCKDALNMARRQGSDIDFDDITNNAGALE